MIRTRDQASFRFATDKIESHRKGCTGQGSRDSITPGEEIVWVQNGLDSGMSSGLVC